MDFSKVVGVCEVCKEAFLKKRIDAKTCSGKCRTKKSRRKNG